MAWINFARTGNPSQPGLVWKPFTAADPQTMVFDVVSECRNLQYEKLAPLLASQAGFPAPPPAPARPWIERSWGQRIAQRYRTKLLLPR
jgi:hypothetical protein